MYHFERSSEMGLPELGEKVSANVENRILLSHRKFGLRQTRTVRLELRALEGQAEVSCSPARASIRMTS